MMEDTKTGAKINSHMQQRNECILASPSHTFDNMLGYCQDIGLLIERLVWIKFQCG
jgi:hypothetical protein